MGGAAADVAHLASSFTVALSDLGVASQAIGGVANGSVFEPQVLVFDVKVLDHKEGASCKSPNSALMCGSMTGSIGGVIILM